MKSAQMQVCDHVLDSLRDDFLAFASEGDYTTEDLVGGVTLALGLMCKAHGVELLESEHIRVTLIEDKPE